MAQLWCSRAGEPQQQCQQDQPTNVRDLPQFLQVLEGVWLNNFLRKPTIYNCNPWFQICQTFLQKPGSVQEQKLFIKIREISNVQLIGTDSSLALLSIGLRSCSKCHDIFPKWWKSQRKMVTKNFYFTQIPQKKSLFLQPYCHSKGPIIKNCLFLAFLAHLQKNTKKQSTCKKKNIENLSSCGGTPIPHQPMHVFLVVEMWWARLLLNHLRSIRQTGFDGGTVVSTDPSAFKPTLFGFGFGPLKVWEGMMFFFLDLRNGNKN